MTDKKEIGDIPTLIKKIGATTYEISVHFSKTSNENMDDKLLRIIKHDSTNSK